MKELTIEQAIDQLSNLGQAIGMKSKVQAWYVGGTEPVQPLSTFTATGIKEGRRDQTAERTAVIYLKP